MLHTSSVHPPSPFILRIMRPDWIPGLFLTFSIAVLATTLNGMKWFDNLGLGALTLAIIFGIIIGNSVFPAIEKRSAPGVDFAKAHLLRLGIILFGFHITFQQIGEVGWAGILIAILMVGLTFLLALLLGPRVFKLNRELSILIGAGSAICGAAAVLATEPVVKPSPDNLAVAIATVVVFGTAGMFIYPVLYGYVGLSEHAYGVLVGSTVHEVAQVVVAGNAVSAAAGAAAVIEKMLRVMLLAPFLIILAASLAYMGSRATQKNKPASRPPIAIPWFALLFIGASAIHSLQWLPHDWTAIVTRVDTFLLAMAMAALGLRTQIGAIRRAGLRPLMLASVLFGFLMLGGYAINWVVMAWMT